MWRRCTQLLPGILAMAMAVALTASRAGAMPSSGGGAAAAPATRPSILENVGIDQHLGAQVPADLAFTNESGHEVHLSDYFGKSNRPIILTLVYYQCPMLCTMELNELVRTMNGMPASMVCGRDYDVLTVSFNPRETPDLAANKRTNYLHEYAHRKEAADAWHFLVGDEPAIRSLTDTVGFRYQYDPKFGQYAHVSGIIILTPTGRISRYFYGIDYTVKDVRLALEEASGGKVGSLADQVILYCFHYDPTTGKYSLAVLNLLKVGGVLTLLALFGFVAMSFRKDFRNESKARAELAAKSRAAAAAPAALPAAEGRAG